MARLVRMSASTPSARDCFISYVRYKALPQLLAAYGSVGGFRAAVSFASSENGLLVIEVVTVDVLFFMILSFARASAFRFLEIPRCRISVMFSGGFFFMSNKTEF